MVKANVYVKFSSQNAWSGPYGEGAAERKKGGGGVNADDAHAERKAWKGAWHDVRVWVTANLESFPDDLVDVKFDVDAQICPSCQRWLIEDVIGHLKLLPRRVKLWAEVKGTTVEVKRTTVWPVEVGQCDTYQVVKEKTKKKG